MAVIHLPSGATVTTFPMPPVGFDPLNAQPATLAEHGFPPKPFGPPELITAWEKLVGESTHFIEPTFRRSDGKRHGPRIESATKATEAAANWCGAVVKAPSGSSFSSVTGQWIVPTPNPADDRGSYFSAIWIGIDGDGSPDVFQAGVECDAAISGGGIQRTIYLWWAWFPDNEVQITNIAVSAGDVVSCILTAINSTTGNVLLKNTTTGTATTFHVSAPKHTALAGNSAEWIAERPEVRGSLARLADYDQTTFTNCAATTAATSTMPATTIQPSAGNNINMMDGAATISQGTILAPSSVQCIYSSTSIVPFKTPIFSRASIFTSESDGTWLMADFDRDGIADLAFIKTSNAPGNKVEVQVASGASQFQTLIFKRESVFAAETDGIWQLADFDRDGIPDLVFIKTSNAPGNKVEVQVASGASQFQTLIFKRESIFASESDGTWLMADFDRDGIADLAFLKTQNTGTGKVEVHIASGVSQFQNLIVEVGSAFSPETDGTWTLADFDRDRIPDLVFIKTANTPGNKVEVHIAQGK
jgi:hypothetical protein